MALPFKLHHFSRKTGVAILMGSNPMHHHSGGIKSICGFLLVDTYEEPDCNAQFAIFGPNHEVCCYILLKEN